MKRCGGSVIVPHDGSTIGPQFGVVVPDLAGGECLPDGNRDGGRSGGGDGKKAPLRRKAEGGHRAQEAPEKREY